MMRPARVVAGLLLGAIALALLVFAINLPWFDETLAPELVALRDSRIEFSGDKAYPALPALSGFACDLRRYAVCADQIVAETVTTNWQRAELAALFDGYSTLIGHGHDLEAREARAQEVSGSGLPSAGATAVVRHGHPSSGELAAEVRMRALTMANIRVATQSPGGGTGRRNGLKIRRSQGHAGSIPARGTNPSTFPC
jgi:hypothetical protein